MGLCCCESHSHTLIISPPDIRDDDNTRPDDDRYDETRQNKSLITAHQISWCVLIVFFYISVVVVSFACFAAYVASLAYVSILLLRTHDARIPRSIRKTDNRLYDYYYIFSLFSERFIYCTIPIPEAEGIFRFYCIWNFYGFFSHIGTHIWKGSFVEVFVIRLFVL